MAGSGGLGIHVTLDLAGSARFGPDVEWVADVDYAVDETRRAGCAVPIVPGIMPITNFAQLARFSDACGAEIPRWIRLKLASFGDDRASIQAFGLDVVSELCERLLATDAPGLHFYTMNTAAPTLELWRRLRLPR